MADQSYQLVVRKGPRPGQVFPLTLETVTIGRDPLSDIVLNDPEISRHHAKIVRSGDGYELQDMGSTNGSFVDGKRMGGDPVSLRPGQVVMLGSNVTLIYQATSASDPMATMIAPSAMPGMQEPEMAEPEPEPEPVPEIMTSPEMRIDEAMSEPEPEPMASYEEPEPMPAYEEPEPEPMPSFEEPEPMPSFDEPEPMRDDVGMATMMEPSYEPEPKPMPSYREPEPMPSFEEPEPMPSYKEPEPLPSFDSGAPLPEYEAQSSYDAPPPVMPGGGTAEKKGGMSRNTMIIIAAIVILCCCCLLIAVAYALSTNPNILAGLDSTVPLANSPITF